MAEISPQDLSDVSTHLYNAVFDDTAWATAVGALRAVMGSQHAALGFFDFRTTQQSLLYGDCTPEFEQRYLELADINPFSPSMLTMQDGDVLIDQQVAPETFDRSAFYDLWMQPQQMHSAMIFKVNARDHISGYLMLNRGGGADKFDAPDLSAVRQLGTTLAHAIGLRVQFGSSTLARTGLALDGRGIGWVAVSATGRLVWTNDRADGLFTDASSAVSARLGMVRLAHPAQMRQFMVALQRATALDPAQRVGTDMIATHPDTGSAIAISVIPAHNLFVQGLPVLRGAHVGLRDLSERLPPGFEDRIRAIFDLTPKEAILAAALASGQAMSDIVRDRGISMPTARSQLAQLFRKTGTAQQSQLVSLLLTVVPLPALEMTAGSQSALSAL